MWLSTTDALLDQKTILETEPGPAISERLAVGDPVRAIVHLRTLTLKTVEALVLVVFFLESRGSRTDFCETTFGDTRIMSACTKVILVRLGHTILRLLGPRHCD